MRTAYEITDCPVCGTIDAEMIAEAEQIREETEQLWAFHTRRVRGDAPPRHLADRAFFSQAPPLAVTRCPCCGLVFRNPRERDRDLTALYAEEAADAAVLQSLCAGQLPFYRSRARRLRRYVDGRGDGLEVGSYVGAFLVAAREEGWSFEGVDVNAATNRFVRALGLRVTDGTIGDVPAEPRFRAIAFWNCFDQLADPRAAARSAYERLRPGSDFLTATASRPRRSRVCSRKRASP